MILENMTIAMCAGCADWFGSSAGRAELVDNMVTKGWYVSDAGHVLCPMCAAAAGRDSRSAIKFGEDRRDDAQTGY